MDFSKNKNILLVEDESVSALYTKELLEEYNYNVFIALNGKKAIEVFNNKPIDLILMDIDLGEGIDGTQTAEIILKNNEIPIVFLSSHSEPETVQKTEKITSYGYIVKGSNIAVIDASIKMAFKLFYEKLKNRKIQQELQEVLDATTDGIWTWDFQTNQLFFSNNYYLMLGYKPNEFPASFESWLSLIHPDDLEEAHSNANTYLESKPEIYKNVFRLKRKDGSFVWIRSFGKVTRRDKEGNALFMIGSHENINETQIYKIKLEQERSDYKRLFDDHAANKLLIDPVSGNIMDANKSAVKFYGYTKDALLHKKIQEINILSPDEVKAEMQKAKENKQTYFEFKHRLANGSIRDVDVYSNKVLFNGKEFLHSIIIDSTQRKKKDKELLLVQDATISCMAILSEFRDTETGAHIERTKSFVRILIENLNENNLSEYDKELIIKSSPLHDIGKIAIPDNILLKPGNLTDAEFNEMKNHTIYGANALRKTEYILGENTFLKFAREIAEFHHEKWDGSGYPHGLIGKKIPLCARIMALADVYDALISERPYKPAFSHEKAFNIIREGKNIHFDPIIVEIFLDTHLDFNSIVESNKD